MEFFRPYVLAVQHFTRMPLAAPARPSAVHWPGVGWLVGLVGCVSFAAVGLLLHGSAYAPLVAAVGSTMATVLLTRAFHEEGLAAFADSLRATGSRAGTYGVLALVLVLLAKVALLTVLAGHSPPSVLLGLICAHVVTRFWPLVLVRLMTGRIATRSEDDPLTAPIEQRGLLLAAAWCVPALLGAAILQGAAFVVLALLFSGAAMWVMKMVVERRLQGLSTDGLGATQQLCELAFYFGAAIAWNAG